MRVVSDVYYLCSFDSPTAVPLFMNWRYLAPSESEKLPSVFMEASVFVFQLRPHCVDVGSPHTIYKRPNEILFVFQFMFDGIWEQSARLLAAITLFGVTPGFGRSVVVGKYFAPRAVAAGLSDLDGRYALYVVSVLHLGQENTLLRPRPCKYGHQNVHWTF